MKVPIVVNQLSISKSDVPLGPYPSLGFVPVSEAELGNGDYYGLYWPLGMEDSEPMVCDMLHDEWALKPSFSSVQKFIEWLALNDWERGEEEIEDEELSSALFFKAKALYAGSNVDSAIVLLKQACNNFPEASEYWFALSSQLRRVGKLEESANAALNAFHSNWVFGRPVQGVLRTLQQAQNVEILGDDPLMQRIESLSLDFGGTKENPAYPIMYECVQEYFNNGQVIKGLMLYQNYAYMMYSETGSFQERYGFELQKWQSEYSKLCLKYLGDNRIYGS